MGKEIVVDINPYQTRVVLMDNGSPSEIYIEQRGKERLVGNIYKGRVQNVLPGMQAAFVDVGLERNAFLYAGDVLPDSSDFQFGEAPELHQEVPNIKDIVKPGQEILVQVLKEPVGTKGVRVTTHITLPGRTLVLMPMVNYIGVSRRIEDERERARLKETISKVKPDNMGVIVRTAALDKSIEEFEADMRFLTRLWERIQKKSQMLTAPRLIHGEEPLVFRTIRDLFTPDIDRLTINDREFYEKVQVVAGIISPKNRKLIKIFVRANIPSGLRAFPAALTFELLSYLVRRYLALCAVDTCVTSQALFYRLSAKNIPVYVFHSRFRHDRRELHDAGDILRSRIYALNLFVLAVEAHYLDFVSARALAGVVRAETGLSVGAKYEVDVVIGRQRILAGSHVRLAR